MFRHLNPKWTLALAVPAAALLLAAAAAATTAKVTFSASNDGASAGWTAGKGSPIDLTIGTSPGSFAELRLGHLKGTPRVANLPEPTFTTDNYAAGSPRFYITLGNGDSLWGYPPNSGLSSDFAWAVNNGNTYESWSAVQASEGGRKVTRVYVIADADQPAGTTDQITGLTFNNTKYN